MEYNDCLKRCIEIYKDEPGAKEIYQSYPHPPYLTWKKCVEAAKVEHSEDDEDFALYCMAEFEVLLDEVGVNTIGRELIEAHVFELIDLPVNRMFAIKMLAHWRETLSEIAASSEH